MSAPFKMKYQGNSSAFPFKEDSGSSKKKYEFKKVFKEAVGDFKEIQEDVSSEAARVKNK